MKINTYHNYTELYKTAGIGGLADEGAEALKQLTKVIDEAGEVGSPAIKSLLEGMGEAASGIARDTDDIFSFLRQMVEETAALRKSIDSGELAAKLSKSEEAFFEADRLRRKHWGRYQNALTKNKALREEMIQLVSKYDEAMAAATKEKTGLRETITSLNDEVAALTAKGKEAYQELAEAATKEGELIKKIDELAENLTKETARADTAEAALETLRKEHAELTAAFEKMVKEADEAKKALKAAEEAGMPKPVVDGLRAAADSKSAAAKELGTRLTQGDQLAQEGLERVIKEQPTPKPDAPAPKGDAPKADPSTPKGGESKSKVPATSGEAAGKGWRQGIQESFKDLATEGVAAVAGRAVKFLAGVALFAFIGLPILLAGGLAAYTVWSWYVSRDIEAARANAREFDQILRNAHAKLSQVRFKSGTRTEQIQQSYLGIMEGCFGLLPEMIQRAEDKAFIQEAGVKLQTLLQQTETFLSLKDVYALDLASDAGWEEAVVAIQELDAAGKQLRDILEQAINKAREQQASPAPGQGRSGGGVTERQRPEPDPNDKGIDILGQKVYLSQYPELDPATRSAAPYLIQKVLLSPTGLSFWDPEGKWGGGYLRNRGSIADQVIKHIRFFLNPRAVDSDWAYGPINNVRKLRKFMRKNMPKAGRKPSSGYKSTRREYRRNDPSLANSNNINISNVDSAMNNRKNRLKMLEKIASSTNRTGISTENIEKYADSVSKEFYQGALRGLDDQYAKSYYTGLKSMYDQKLGGGKADYKSLYEPHGGTGTEILESSHPKSVVVSDAMGNGGLVENVLEQQRHDIGVALSTPTGNFRGKHANLVAALTKIANAADESNNLEVSDIVDNAIEDIVSILKS